MDNAAKEKIEHEISRIDKLLDEASPLLDLCRLKTPDFVEISALAQILHSFYNGVESIVILIFKSANIKLPNDTRWHKTLFEMAFQPNVNKFQIFRNDVKDILEKYLLFRHFIRHSYSSELDWDEMKGLSKDIRKIWEIIKADFTTFIENS